MELKTYLLSLEKPEREVFARKCDTSVAHLFNCSYGSRAPSAKLAVLIERNSKRAVRRQDLFPYEFRQIWPELKGA